MFFRERSCKSDLGEARPLQWLKESRYDPDTGTLYCNGQIITKNTIDLAEGFYKNMQAKCDLKTPEGRQMAAISDRT